MSKLDVMNDSHMSDDDDVESRGSQSSAEEKGYIYSIIEDIIDEWPENKDLDEEEIYDQLVEKAKSNFKMHQIMENDDLWQDVVSKSDSYKEEMNADISDTASIEMAIHNYKPVMMEEITKAIDDNSDNVDVDDESEEDDEEEEDVFEGSTQVGGRHSSRYTYR